MGSVPMFLAIPVLIQGARAVVSFEATSHQGRLGLQERESLACLAVILAEVRWLLRRAEDVSTEARTACRQNPDSLSVSPTASSRSHEASLCRKRFHHLAALRPLFHALFSR